MFTVSCARRPISIAELCRAAELLGVAHGDVAIERARTDSVQFVVQVRG